jgi:tetratricopeptide (TPR) repeat protein
MSTRSKLSGHHNQQFLPASGNNLRRTYALSSTDNYTIKDSNLISQKLLEEGKSLLEMKSNVEAISLFNKAFHLDSGKFEALLYKAIALMDSNKFEEAIDTFLQVINKDSSEKVKTAYLLLAIAYKNNNQVELGIKVLDELLKKQKNNAKALIYKGKLLAEIGKWQEAKNTFDIAIKLNANNIGAYLALFDCEFHLKNYKAADGVYSRILNFDESIPIKSIIRE